MRTVLGFTSFTPTYEAAGPALSEEAENGGAVQWPHDVPPDSPRNPAPVRRPDDGLDGQVIKLL